MFVIPHAPQGRGFTVVVTKAMSNAIRDAMDRAGLNQAQLIEKSNVSRTQIHRLLKGTQRDVRLSTLQRIAKACSCTVSDLLGEK